jgi:ATP-dependent DNA helicase RecG
MYHPEYILLPNGISLPLETTLTPVYPTTEGISQAKLRSVVLQALDLGNKGTLMHDYLSGISSTLHPFPTLLSSIQCVHQPPVDVDTSQLEEGTHPAQQRLAFEELLAHHLSLQKSRDRVLSHSAPATLPPGKKISEFLDNLEFSLTRSQSRTFTEIATDMQQGQPMLRLLQGDVGSGKTVVAAMAAILARENGYQTAIMAPTEILAEQHLENFTRWLEPLDIQIAWLSGKLKGKKRLEQLSRIDDGSASVIIGTHALFQADVHFSDLGLVIIDEQHKFGVHQRLALKEKGVRRQIHPHQLIMTATPIPRTLTMSIYADLDCSVIDELPPGRTPVVTTVFPDRRRDEIIKRVEQACTSGRQAYWVCTLIDESEALECQAAEATAKLLRESLPGLQVGLVHGRLPAAEKASTMADFKSGLIHLLVATTVIEVGVDVANASLMIIENPERLGLAQLHQLRGRVGRGSTESHCLLMYRAPLSELSRQRLTVMRETNDGFKIAEEDLRIRGPGDVLGTRQTGDISFRIADVVRDAYLLDYVREVGTRIRQSRRAVIEPIIDRWLVNAERYSNV